MNVKDGTEPKYPSIVFLSIYSLDNKVNPISFAIIVKRVKVLDQKGFDKTIVAQVHGSSTVIFNFLENDDFFWNSVESLEFLNIVT